MSDESSKSNRGYASDKPTTAGGGWHLVNFDVLKDPPTTLAALVYVVLWLFVLAVLVLVGFGLFASFHIAYETAVGDFKDRIEAAKVFFPILLALVGGPLLIWRVITAHIQAQAARHQADTGREAHYTSLFTKAVEQLGATREVKETIEAQEVDGGTKRETITKTEPNLEVRLGAIYALDRVARDSERDHWPIMEVLCAYVRNPQNSGPRSVPPAGVEPGTDEFEEWLNSIAQPRVDLQAALTIVGSRRGDRREHEATNHLGLDLRGLNLQHAVLNKGYFENANFEDAYLIGAFCVEAHLSGAWFQSANLSRAWLSEADINDAWFDSAQLDGAVFHEAHAANATFDGANLAGASFVRANLTRASFGRAQLAGAEFNGANLSDARFYGCRLGDVWFSEAKLAGASFDTSDFAGALLFHTDLSAAGIPNTAAVADALGDASTKLPERVKPPANWPNRILKDDERLVWIQEARAARSRKS